MSVAAEEFCEQCLRSDRYVVHADKDGRQICSTCYAAGAETLPDEELQVDSQSNGKPKGRQRGGGHLVLHDVGRMLATEPDPVDWLVNGVVARGTLTPLSGREKEGKSLLTMAFAASVATGGGSVVGIECAPGRVLIIDAENGQREVHRRVRALGLERADGFHYAEPERFDLGKDLSELERLLDDLEPNLVVLDSFRSLWKGEENDSGETAAVLYPLQQVFARRNIGGLLVHHMRKNGGYRGSAAIGGAVDNLVELARLDDDEDRRRRRLRNPACRFEEETADRWLRLEADRKLGCLFVEPAEPLVGDEEEQRPAPVREQLADRIEQELEFDAPARLKDICLVVGRGPKDGSVRNALRALEAQDRVLRTGEGWVRCKVQGATAPNGDCTIAPCTTLHLVTDGDS